MQIRHPNFRGPIGLVIGLAIALVLGLPHGCSKRASTSPDAPPSEAAAPADIPPADSSVAANPTIRSQGTATEASTAAQDAEVTSPANSTAAGGGGQPEESSDNGTVTFSPDSPSSPSRPLSPPAKSAAKPPSQIVKNLPVGSAPPARHIFPPPPSAPTPTPSPSPPPTRAVEGGGPATTAVPPSVAIPPAATPLPTPAAAPSPTAPSADNTGTAPPEYWNAWTEEACTRFWRLGLRCSYVPVLEPGKPYNFLISISNQALTEAVAGPVSASIPAHLVSMKTGTVRLKIVPLLTDGSLELPIDAPRVYDLEVKLNKLGLPSPTSAPETTPAGSTSADPSSSTPDPTQSPTEPGSQAPEDPPAATKPGSAALSGEPRAFSVALESNSTAALPTSISDQPTTPPVLAQTTTAPAPTVSAALTLGAQPAPPAPETIAPTAALPVTPAPPAPISSPTPTKELIGLARKYSAGAVQIPILVSDTPMACAYITLSIWDEALRKPLDSLIIPIQIHTDSAPNGGCKAAYRGDKIVGGFDSLVSLKTSASETLPVGLHAFVLENPAGVKRSFAVVAVHDGPKPRIYGWETDSVLSDVFTQPHGLVELIEGARAVFAAGKSTPEQLAHAYAIAATVLREKIFSARHDQGPSAKDAHDAFMALQDLVSKSNTPLIVYSRFTAPGRGGADLYYAPLRLFSAPGADFLTKDVELIQPLPFERSSGASCISNWTLIGSPAVAEDTSDTAKDDMDKMLQLKSEWISEIISDPVRLVNYFKGIDSSTTSATAPAGAAITTPNTAATAAPRSPATPLNDGPAQGLLVLAHHDKDKGLWFATQDKPVIVDTISRQFPIGSVAVLGACSTAGPGAADSLIRRLNEHQVDGMIASAFSVDTEYAIRFAYELTQLLQDAYANHQTPTMAELFSKAFAATGLGYEKENHGFRQQIGLEFMLMGNPDLRLCKR